jgi:hypothetical protein
VLGFRRCCQTVAAVSAAARACWASGSHDHIKLSIKARGVAQSEQRSAVGANGSLPWQLSALTTPKRAEREAAAAKKSMQRDAGYLCVAEV